MIKEENRTLLCVTSSHAFNAVPWFTSAMLLNWVYLGAIDNPSIALRAAVVLQMSVCALLANSTMLFYVLYTT